MHPTFVALWTQWICGPGVSSEINVGVLCLKVSERQGLEHPKPDTTGRESVLQKEGLQCEDSAR